MAKEFFISGIDTDCGKTYITGLLAKSLKQQRQSVITSKLIQTGCNGISEDILEHRRLMGTGVLAVDKQGLTCPIVLSFPASPHLASAIDNCSPNFNQVRKATDELLGQYEICLSEGAGGLMVPLTEDYLTIDYISDYKLPLILVASSKLGSINHTLLSLAVCQQKKINLQLLIYNEMPGSDPQIAKDSFAYFQNYLKKHFPQTKIIHVHEIEKAAAYVCTL